MHGLKTITELNELAVQNSPEVVAANLAAAEEKHKGEPKLTSAYGEARALRDAQKEAVIEALTNETFEQLIDRLDAIQFPSNLEAAVCRKLKVYLARFAENENHPAIGDGHYEPECVGVSTPVPPAPVGGVWSGEVAHTAGCCGCEDDHY